MNKVIIDFNPQKSRFELTIPYMMNGVAQGIPSRKWNKAARKWFAPSVRKNAEYISKNIAPMTMSTLTDAAHKELVASLERKHAVATEAFPAWYDFKLKPRKYQMDAMNQLFSLNEGALFMAMGTGKTMTTISLMAARAMSPGDLNINSLVVLCPFSIRNNWLKELEKHCPIAYSGCVLDYQTQKGRRKYAVMMQDTTKLRVLIVGIESMSSGQASTHVERFLMSTKAGIVVDESSKIKSPTAKRTKTITDLGRLSAYRLILTGTPITQGMIDLYSQMDFLSPDIIGVGDFYSFRNTYAVMGGFNNKEIIGYKNTDALLESIAPYVFQVTREEALPELPERNYVTRNVPLTTEQARIYKDLVQTKTAMIPGEEVTEMSVENALEQLLRIQQVCGGFTVRQHVDPITEKVITTPVPLASNKVAEVVLIAEESADNMVIWARFRPEIKAIADALRKRFGDESVVEFHGGIGSEQRWDNVKKFESNQARFFVANQQTGGIGLDLLAATIAIFYSNSFSYEDRVQSEARNHRLGQKNKVTYIDLVCAGTVETQILEALEQKGTMAAYVRDVLQHGNNPLHALSKDGVDI